MIRWRGGPALWLMRLATVAGPVVATLLTDVVGPRPGPWLVILVAVLGCGWAIFPESAVGIAVLGLVVAWWAVGPDGDDALHPVVVAVAACLVLAHLAALLASYAPAEAVPPRRLVQLWLRRGLAVLLPVPALLTLAWLLRGDVDVAGAWTAGLVGVMAATALCALAVRGAGEDASS